MVRRQRAPVAPISTTLSAGITDSATSWTVASATGLPTEGDFYLARGAEIVLVTAISGTTLTVIRAQCGTEAKAANSGDSVKSIITSCEYNNRLKDYGRIQAAAYGRVLDVNGTAIPASSWTVVNSSTGASVADGPDGTIRVTSRTHSGNDLTGAQVTYSSGYGNKKYTAHLSSPTIKPISGDHFGLFARQSSGGLFYGITFYPGINIQAETRASFLVDPSAIPATHGAPWRRDVWMRLEQRWDDPVSDSLAFSYSWDGVRWWLMHTWTGLALGASEIGLYMSNRTGVTFQSAFIETWIEESVA